MQFECCRATVLRAERAARQSRKCSKDRGERYGKRNIAANGKRGEVGRRDLFGDKAESHRSCRSTQSFRTVESLFMRQP